MKRKIVSVFSIVSLLVFMFCLTACGNKQNSNDSKTESVTAAENFVANAELVATWDAVELEDAYYIFNDDGTGEFVNNGKSSKFAYLPEGENLTIIYPDGNKTKLTYEIQNNTLALDNEKTGSFEVYLKRGVYGKETLPPEENEFEEFTTAPFSSIINR